VRLVIDCNVIISAALTAGTCRQLVEEAVQEHTILICEDIIAEYRAVAMRTKFSSRRDILDEIISTIEAVGLLVSVPLTGFALPDPADEIYLATAVAGGADALITGNTRHFEGCCGEKLQLLTPRQFLDRGV
jgi:uncharacterized protein